MVVGGVVWLKLRAQLCVRVSMQHAFYHCLYHASSEGTAFNLPSTTYSSLLINGSCNCSLLINSSADLSVLLINSYLLIKSSCNSSLLINSSADHSVLLINRYCSSIVLSMVLC